MGIYDRDYLRQQQPGYHIGGDMTVTTKIILVTAAVYLLQIVTKQPVPGAPYGQLNELLALHADWFKQPWRVFELLTYGFMHSVNDLKHILFNMLIVWFLGRHLEQRYGRREFLVFYLVAIVIAGLVWSTVTFAKGGPSSVATCWGASGACSAILILFAFNWPQQKLLLWFVIPVPVWLLAGLALAHDIYGSFAHQQDNIGYEAHLGGAFFALLYYKNGWRLERFLPKGGGGKKRRKKTKLKVHEPPREDALDTKVDDILRKIQSEGQESLSSKERKFLEEASKEYQQKKRK